MPNATTPHRPHVVILGAGFAGLAAARALARAPVFVTLVDRQNHHLFQPLLYQVATAGLSANDIAAPVREVFKHQRNVQVVLDEAREIDVESRRVTLGRGALDYDYLVVATGVQQSYFGNDDWAPHAPGLKTVKDALEIRRRILLAFEGAEREANAERRREWLTFVVVGAGPTGVELAGAIAEIARHTLTSDFKSFDATQTRVVLVEGGERVLPMFDPQLSRRATEQLEAFSVDVRTGARVTGVDDKGVLISDERIDARTVLWAAGVEASGLGAQLGAATDRAGRVEVTGDLSLPSRPEIFVAGDLASVEIDGQKVPGLAPAALQAGRHVGEAIKADVRGRARPTFRYRDKGNLATIGRSAAVGQIGRLRLWGLWAWLTWLAVHVFFLVGFRNRLLVLFQWAWAYVTYARGARVVADPDDYAARLPSIAPGDVARRHRSSTTETQAPDDAPASPPLARRAGA
jgi:NADH dehydrogenase